MIRSPRLLAIGLAMAALTGLSVANLATAADHQSDLGEGGNDPITLAVYGDAPYSNVPADWSKNPPNETGEFDASPAFISAVNKDNKVKLVLFAGDIHSGKQPCTLAYDKAIARLWTAFRDPFVYTPGDNEWADCHKSGEGGNVQYPPLSGNYVDYANGNPVANLGLVRQIFFANPGQVLGGGSMRVLSQARAFDPAHPSDAEYVENVMWEQSGVLFVSVNIPGGSNNGADPWYGAAETGEQAQERTQRTAADLRWLDSAFTQASTDHVSAVMILTQADMWDLDGKAASHIVGYEPFIANIATNTAAFGKPVLLVNGDSHVFRSDNPLVNDAPCITEAGACTDDGYDTHTAFNSTNSINVPNFHRIVVHGSTFPLEYLRLSINTRHAPAAGPDSFGPFSWERVQP